MQNKQKQLKIKEKQTDALIDLKANGKKKQINNAYDYENKSLTLIEREIFKNIYNERLDKIEEPTKKIWG